METKCFFLEDSRTKTDKIVIADLESVLGSTTIHLRAQRHAREYYVDVKPQCGGI